MLNTKKLADLLLPGVNRTPADIFSRYPRRSLPENAKVTRFAPSPTGLVHVGGLYATFVSEMLEHQSRGIFYLRVEDTDKKREVAGSISDMINSLAYFGIHFDEGQTAGGGENGAYGPYKQSERAEIYLVFVKQLLEKGYAYPCFCSPEELDQIRQSQKETGARTGYYGEWAKHRHASMEEIEQNLACGKPFVIRLKSPGSVEKWINHQDMIKGSIQIPENDQDIVILKSDGLPTYHFAHAVDDYLMGTTHVIRGDEWISSIPLHLQLFEVLGFKPPVYGHIAPIMKQEGASKRKFSKRKDPDGAAAYYRQQGYPGLAVAEYFMYLMNSNFEEWRLKHPAEPYTSFQVDTGKMSVSGALLDINKLNDISRDIIAGFSTEKVYDQVCDWVEKYDRELFELLSRYKDYSTAIFGIGRTAEKPRKDLAKWADAKPVFAYFFDELFDKEVQDGYVPLSTIDVNTVRHLVLQYKEMYRHEDDKDKWFGRVKELAVAAGFADNARTYRKNPGEYKGHVGDVAAVLRVALTNRLNTPDLYDIMQVMGRERVLQRLDRAAIII